MAKRRLLIIGAGPMARETYHYAVQTFPELEMVGFLDDRGDVLDGFEGYPPILGSVEGFCEQENDVFLCAIGDPIQRKKYASIMEERGVKFATLIHPQAFVGGNVEIGEGSVVAPSVVITCDVKLGRHVIVNVQSSISHDCVLADFVTLSPGCHLPGGCRLGEGVFMGAHSTIVPNVSLAVGAFVGAGAVVVDSDATPNIRLMGVPARSK